MSREETWQLLEQQEQAGFGFLSRRVSEVSVLDLYLAVSKPANVRALLLHMPSGLVQVSGIPFATKGLTCQIEPSAVQELSWLRLTPADRSFNGIFATLVEDVLATIAEASTAEEATNLFFRRIEQWRVLFERTRENILSREQQRGLFSELRVLRDHCLTALPPEEAITAWAGPFGTPHDFQFETIAIEVKSTASNAPDHVRINGERQLEAGTGFRLWLVVLCLDERLAGGDESLGDVVDSVRSLLDGSSLAAMEFEERLSASRFRDAHRTEYDHRSYTVLEERIFQVNQEFPKLGPAILPKGISSVAYDLSLAACAPFSVTGTDLGNALAGMEDS